MYTSGIRKTPAISAKSIIDAKGIADRCGFDCFSFNGEIYAKVEHKRVVGRLWVKTPFVISDFIVSL